MLIKSMYWNDKKMFFKHVLDNDSPSSSSCLFLRNSSFLFCSLKKKHIHFLMSNSIMKINNTRRHLQTNNCCCTYLWFIGIANTSKTLDSSVLKHHTSDDIPHLVSSSLHLSFSLTSPPPPLPTFLSSFDLEYNI